MKILIADDISERAVGLLRAEASWQVVDLGREKGDAAARRRRLEEELHGAEALVIRSATKVTAELLEHAPRLRVIGRAGVGVDNVDLEAATRKGVVVMNTPGGNAESVAEHTLALMLALVRRIPQADASLKQQRWEKKAFTGLELRGKALGLVGFGRVGAEVSRLAQALEMQVSAYDPHIAPRVASDHNVKLVSLEEIFSTSDFISLHASATPESRHLVNARTLALAKPGVRIVNCARGELVDEAALLEALESGQVAGAGLDVFETEPPKGSPVVAHANVIATPHIAGSTEEAQEIVGIRIAEQVRDYLTDGVVRNAVNLPPVSAEEYRRLRPYIELGEKLGGFLAQIAGRPLSEIRISYDGGLAELNTNLVKNAVLKGALSRTFADEEVNLVNAGSVAQSRGLEVTEVRSARRAGFSNSLGVALRSGAETASVLGMVGLHNSLRILGLNDVDVEAPLKGVILVIQNQDVPGVIGRVGTLLGQRQINIGSFALGRNADSREAIGLINVDQLVPADVLAEVRAIPALRSARVVEMD
ncbi:MAG TPA: phosphoglycerate dehydrogenase [Terriglobia bacterium]|nr:phosphoglycerate dehydrogenase [Terriglobia bacterium]